MLCPPVYLIPRVIGHARKCRAVGMLVVPEWPSAPFWPILYPNGKGSKAIYYKHCGTAQMEHNPPIPPGHTTSNWACQKVSRSWHAGGS